MTNLPDWQKHLDELDEFNSPDNFWFAKLAKAGSQRAAENFEPESLIDPEYEGEGQLSLDITQDENNYYVYAPIAGVRPENVQISLEDDVLTIKGSRDSTHEQKGKDFLVKECYCGKFSRSVVLPGSVQNKKINAEVKNQILKIKLPKDESRKRMEIKIKHD